MNLHLGQPDAKVRKRQAAALAYLGLTEKQTGSLYHLSEGQKKMVQLIAMLSLERTFAVG